MANSTLPFRSATVGDVNNSHSTYVITHVHNLNSLKPQTNDKAPFSAAMALKCRSLNSSKGLTCGCRPHQTRELVVIRPDWMAPTDAALWESAFQSRCSIYFFSSLLLNCGSVNFRNVLFLFIFFCVPRFLHGAVCVEQQAYQAAKLLQAANDQA